MTEISTIDKQISHTYRFMNQEQNTELQHHKGNLNMVAPTKTKLTLQDIKDVIVSERYDLIPKADGTHNTVCTLTLKNGANVIGINYGSIDPTNFDTVEGKKQAYQKAEDQVWELEGYLLRQSLSGIKTVYCEQESTPEDKVPDEDIYKGVFDKLVKDLGTGVYTKREDKEWWRQPHNWSSLPVSAFPSSIYPFGGDKITCAINMPSDSDISTLTALIQGNQTSGLR